MASLTTQLDAKVAELGGDRPIHRWAPLRLKAVTCSQMDTLHQTI